MESYFIDQYSCLHFDRNNRSIIIMSNEGTSGPEHSKAEQPIDIISKQIDQSHVRLVDEKFFRLATEIQLDILASILNRFREATKHLENKMYEIETKRFMGFYPGLEMSLADSLDDRSDCSPAHYAVLRGTFIGRSFPEVIDQPERHFNSPTDFDLSGGVPCMSFRDDTNEVTYVIPIDAITRLDSV